MAVPVANLLEISTALERQLDIYATTRGSSGARDAANQVAAHFSEFLDYLVRTTPIQLYRHLNEITAQQSARGFDLPMLNAKDITNPNGGLRTNLLLWNKWNQSRREHGVKDGCSTLSDLLEKISKRDSASLGDPGERVKAVAEFLENCLAEDFKTIETPYTIMKGSRWQLDSDDPYQRVTAQTLQSKENDITTAYRRVSAGGATVDSQRLDQLAQQSVDFLYQLTTDLDPRNEKSLMHAMLGESAGEAETSSFSPDSAFGNLPGLDPMDEPLKAEYEEGSFKGSIFHKVRHVGWGALNSGLGLNPNLDLMYNSGKNGRAEDPQYQRLDHASDLGLTAADRLHRDTHDLAGRITYQISKANRTVHLELVRRIGELIEQDPRFKEKFPGAHFDVQGCLKKMHGAFGQPGQESYLMLHLAQSFHVPALQGVASKLLSIFDVRQSNRLRQQYMTEKGPEGKPIPIPASLYATLSIFGLGLGHKLAETQMDLSNLPQNSPNEALTGQHFARTTGRNNALTKLRYIQSKVNATTEQLERPYNAEEFSLGRMNPKVMEAFKKGVPAFNFFTYNFFAIWNFTRRIPVIGWPLVIIEGVHGFTGAALSFVGSLGGLIPSAKTAIDRAWSWTSPNHVRNIINYTLGKHYQVNACAAMLSCGITPYYSALDSMNRIQNGAAPEDINSQSLRADLYNTYIFFDSFVADMIKASRHGVGVNAKFAQRLGVPNLQMKTITDKNGSTQQVLNPDQYIDPLSVIEHFHNKVEDFYKHTYATAGETSFRVKYPLVSENNPTRFDEAPFGRYLKQPSLNPITGEFDPQITGSETYIIYSDTYWGLDDERKPVNIGPNDCEEKKAIARALNKRDYLAQLKEKEKNAASLHDTIREHALNANGLINIMRPRMRMWKEALKEARRFASVNTTQLCAGDQNKLIMRNTPFTIHDGHKLARTPFEDEPLTTTPPANHTVPFLRHAEKIQSGPTLDAPYSATVGGLPLAVTGNPAGPAFTHGYLNEAMSH
jgi:hypothetical protein